jgi:hypothetical protein
MAAWETQQRPVESQADLEDRDELVELLTAFPDWKQLVELLTAFPDWEDSWVPRGGSPATGRSLHQAAHGRVHGVVAGRWIHPGPVAGPPRRGRLRELLTSPASLVVARRARVREDHSTRAVSRLGVSSWRRARPTAAVTNSSPRALAAATTLGPRAWPREQEEALAEGMV